MFYGVRPRPSLVLNATDFETILPKNTPPGSFILGIGYVILHRLTERPAVISPLFLQTDNFHFPFIINERSGTVTTLYDLEVGKYDIPFWVIVQPYGVVNGTLKVNVIPNLGKSIVCIYIP